MKQAWWSFGTEEVLRVLDIMPSDCFIVLSQVKMQKSPCSRWERGRRGWLVSDGLTPPRPQDSAGVLSEGDVPAARTGQCQHSKQVCVGISLKIIIINVKKKKCCANSIYDCNWWRNTITALWGLSRRIRKILYIKTLYIRIRLSLQSFSEEMTCCCDYLLVQVEKCQMTARKKIRLWIIIFAMPQYIWYFNIYASFPIFFCKATFLWQTLFMSSYLSSVNRGNNILTPQQK